MWARTLATLARRMQVPRRFLFHRWRRRVSSDAQKHVRECAHACMHGRSPTALASFRGSLAARRSTHGPSSTTEAAPKSVLTTTQSMRITDGHGSTDTPMVRHAKVKPASLEASCCEPTLRIPPSLARSVATCACIYSKAQTANRGVTKRDATALHRDATEQILGVTRRPGLSVSDLEASLSRATEGQEGRHNKPACFLM